MIMKGPTVLHPHPVFKPLLGIAKCGARGTDATTSPGLLGVTVVFATLLHASWSWCDADV